MLASAPEIARETPRSEMAIIQMPTERTHLNAANPNSPQPNFIKRAISWLARKPDPELHIARSQPFIKLEYFLMAVCMATLALVGWTQLEKPGQVFIDENVYSNDPALLHELFGIPGAGIGALLGGRLYFMWRTLLFDIGKSDHTPVSRKKLVGAIILSTLFDVVSYFSLFWVAVLLRMFLLLRDSDMVPSNAQAIIGGCDAGLCLFGIRQLAKDCDKVKTTQLLWHASSNMPLVQDTDGSETCLDGARRFLL